MITAMAIPGNTADTFLTHLFGNGLKDDHYVVERYRAMADGDIRPCEAFLPKTGSGSRNRRKVRRVVATLKAVKELRPAPNEIIVCTAMNLKRSGVQYWGSISTGLFCVRRQKG